MTTTTNTTTRTMELNTYLKGIFRQLKLSSVDLTKGLNARTRKALNLQKKKSIFGDVNFDNDTAKTTLTLYDAINALDKALKEVQAKAIEDATTDNMTLDELEQIETFFKAVKKIAFKQSTATVDLKAYTNNLCNALAEDRKADFCKEFEFLFGVKIDAHYDALNVRMTSVRTLESNYKMTDYIMSLVREDLVRRGKYKPTAVKVETAEILKSVTIVKRSEVFVDGRIPAGVMYGALHRFNVVYKSNASYEDLQKKAKNAIVKNCALVPDCLLKSVDADVTGAKEIFTNTNQAQ